MNYQADFDTLQNKIRVEFYKNDAQTYPSVANILQSAAKFPIKIRSQSHLSNVLKVLNNEEIIYLTESIGTVYAFEPNSRTVVSFHSDDKWYKPIFNFSPQFVIDLFVNAYRYETNPFKQLQILQQLQHLDHARFLELYQRFIQDNSELSRQKITTNYHCSSGQSYSMDKILFTFGKEDFFLHFNRPIESQASNSVIEVDMAVEKLDFNILQNFFSA